MAPSGDKAVGKSKEDDLEDAYALLGVGEDADDKEITGAFRKGSLKVHPDRNPDDPDAADKFDRLQRAKELLLDPMRRAEMDRKRKAVREQEARHSEEDAKRRKLREDLEAREGVHSAAVARRDEAAAAAERQKKHAQMDFAARIKAKEAQMASKQAEIAAVVAGARQNAEDARVVARWKERGDPASRAQAVRKALAPFDVRTITATGETEVNVQLGSREDALAAVLECRARRQQLGFRLLLLDAAPPRKAPARPEPAPFGAAGETAAAGAGGASFDDWEADMLSNLKSLAEAQKAAKSA